MSEILHLLALFLGAFCFVGCVERLGKVNWFESKAVSVVMYLCGTIWAIWLLKDAIFGGVEWYQLLGGTFILCVLWISRHRWKGGPPPEVTRFPEEAVITVRSRHDD